MLAVAHGRANLSYTNKLCKLCVHFLAPMDLTSATVDLLLNEQTLRTAFRETARALLRDGKASPVLLGDFERSIDSAVADTQLIDHVVGYLAHSIVTRDLLHLTTGRAAVVCARKSLLYRMAVSELRSTKLQLLLQQAEVSSSETRRELVRAIVSDITLRALSLFKEDIDHITKIADSMIAQVDDLLPELR